MDVDLKKVAQMVNEDLDKAVENVRIARKNAERMTKSHDRLLSALNELGQAVAKLHRGQQELIRDMAAWKPPVPCDDELITMIEAFEDKVRANVVMQN